MLLSSAALQHFGVTTDAMNRIVGCREIVQALRLALGKQAPEPLYFDVSSCDSLHAVVSTLKDFYDVASQDPLAPWVAVPRVGDGSDCGRPLRADDLDRMGVPLFDHVALGGTFDHLHAGHRLLLSTAAMQARCILRVGVTGPALLVNKKFAQSMQPFDVRAAAARAFLSQLREDLRLDVVELTEASGGTNAIADVTAMVVSNETLPSLATINETRAQGGLKPMQPILIDFVGGSDVASKLSSTQLRRMQQ